MFVLLSAEYIYGFYVCRDTCHLVDIIGLWGLYIVAIRTDNDKNY